MINLSESERREILKTHAVKEAMASIENRVRHVYNKGFEDGVSDARGQGSQSDMEKGARLAFKNFIEWIKNWFELSEYYDGEEPAAIPLEQILEQVDDAKEYTIKCIYEDANKEPEEKEHGET